MLSTIKEKNNNNWIHHSGAKRQQPVEKLPSERKPGADPASGGRSHLQSPVGGRRKFQNNEKIEIEVVSEYQTARSLHDRCMKQPCDKTSQPPPPPPHTATSPTFPPQFRRLCNLSARALELSWVGVSSIFARLHMTTVST